MLMVTRFLAVVALAGKTLGHQLEHSQSTSHGATSLKPQRRERKSDRLSIGTVFVH